MGIISIEKADHLFWLGRYTERVFTTLQTFFKFYDQMIDCNDTAYQVYCKELGIPDIYGSKEAFAMHYINDETNTNSILSNLIRAYDNAIVCRDEVSSMSLSYLELSMSELRKSKNLSAPVFSLQGVVDKLYAFWGSIDDCMLDEESRNLVKCGRYLERIDLYLRFDFPYESIEKEFNKFKKRLTRTRFGYDCVNLQKFTELIEAKNITGEYKIDALIALSGIF